MDSVVTAEGVVEAAVEVGLVTEVDGVVDGVGLVTEVVAVVDGVVELVLVVEGGVGEVPLAVAVVPPEVDEVVLEPSAAEHLKLSLRNTDTMGFSLPR